MERGFEDGSEGCWRPPVTPFKNEDGEELTARKKGSGREKEKRWDRTGRSSQEIEEPGKSRGRHKAIPISEVDAKVLSAAVAGDILALRSALEEGGDKNVMSPEGHTPSFLAIEYDQVELLKELLKARANVDLAEYKSSLPTHLATERFSLETLQLLLEAGAGPNVLGGEKGASPLYAAAAVGNAAALRLLLKARADANLASESGATPLYAACEGGYLDAVNHLLRAKADPKLADKKGSAPIHGAAAGGHALILHMLTTEVTAVTA